MSNGYVLMEKSSKITKGILYNGNVHPSELGIILLEQIKMGTIENYIEKQLELGNGIPIERLPLKRSELVNKEQLEGFAYNYIYTSSNHTLKVYTEDDLLYTIPMDKIDVYIYLFLHDHELYEVFRYDEKTCMCTKGYRQELKKYIKSQDLQISNLQALVQGFRERPIIDETRFADAWENSYKRVINFDGKPIVEFIVQEKNNKHIVYFQAPYMRIQVFKGKNNKICEEYIRDIVCKYGKALLGTYKLSQLFLSINSQISTLSFEAITYNEHKELLGQLRTQYRAILENQPCWLAPGMYIDNFETAFNHTLSSHYQSLLRGNGKIAQ